MKKQTKGLMFTVLFGGGLLFWATAASLPGVDTGTSMTGPLTGTPLDNIPIDQRDQFCGVDEASSTKYVQEFKIPTVCTQPLGITTDSQGNVWFGQTNTGNVSKFDPTTQTFTEYDNPRWPDGSRSMMWGMDYAPDGTIWYTDEAHNRIWQFTISDEQYVDITYPSTSESLPQRLDIDGSQILVNDFTGGKLTILDAAQVGEDISYFTIPAQPGTLVGDFATDSQNNMWYTNWVFQSGGVLVKLDRNSYTDGAEITNHASLYNLPTDLTTPNGLVIGPEENVWIMDTSSSFFFSFDPTTAEFTKYVTSTPSPAAYGNASGLIKQPISRPYWADTDDYGRIIFNEQTANRIGFFDPIQQSLVEYLIPSKNPNWSDCEGLDDCGLSQAFDFTIQDKKVWFTEWVENNIGVVDTAISLPFSITVDTNEVTLVRGDSIQVQMTIQPDDISGIGAVTFNTADTAEFSDITVHPTVTSFDLSSGEPQTFDITINTSRAALDGTHKVLLGAQTDDVAVSQYLTVNIVR